MTCPKTKAKAALNPHPNTSAINPQAVINTQAAELCDVVLDVITERDGTLTGMLGYNSGLFDSSSAERLASHFVLLLDTMVQVRTKPICSYPSLSQTAALVSMLSSHVTIYSQDPDRPTEECSALPDNECHLILNVCNTSLHCHPAMETY